MNVTVCTWTFRDSERLRVQAECLRAQTFEDFEWVLIDDLWEGRQGFLDDMELPFPVVHKPPREVIEHYAPDMAVNTGLVYARGELIYFMGDSIKVLPGTLERHWEIYEAYGPNVIIGGQVHGHDIQSRSYDQGLETDLFEIVKPDTLIRNAFLGRNDSAPLDRILDVNGLDEHFGMRSGTDTIFAQRLMQLGCRYLVDTKETVEMVTGHKPRKPERGFGPRWQDEYGLACQGPSTSSCPINLRAEREKICVSS